MRHRTLRRHWVSHLIRVRDLFASIDGMTSEHDVAEHGTDVHLHGSGCGHETVTHDGHTDYVHDGHLHHEHDGHYDEHGEVAGA